MHDMFFFLPIHRRSEARYYSENEAEAEGNKFKLEQQSGHKFEELPRGLQVQYEDGWQWPYWLYNDIVGFVEIGMDGANHMTGNIFLKRKHHPPTSIWKRGGNRTTLQNQQTLFYSEIDKTKVNDLNDNSDFISALEIIIGSARKILKTRNRRFVLWLPDYSFNNMDFVRLYKELLE